MDAYHLCGCSALRSAPSGRLKACGSRLNEKLVASRVFKILEVQGYLYRNDAVHCDLKEANILTRPGA